MQKIKVPIPGSAILTVLIVLCVLIVVAAWIGVTVSSKIYYVEGVRGTRRCLDGSRAAIEDFAKHNGRFPGSLTELSAHMKRLHIPRWLPKEWISKRRGDFSEHRELDGTGGIYYNPATGEIKVNLTKPVRCYRRTYIGPSRTDIPADW